jgi:hypothetical protein
MTGIYAGGGDLSGLHGSLLRDGAERTLVYPFRTGFAPRLALALRLPKSTVLRAGYAINFNNGQYSTLLRRWCISRRLRMCRRMTRTLARYRWRMAFRTPESEPGA